jgi:hypothetical protein
LFNLYAFTFSDSFQKRINFTTEDTQLNTDYLIPTLELINVECRNFLNDYQSLIHLENDNFVTRADITAKLSHQYGSNQVDGKVAIINSKFVDSSFTFGMLFVSSHAP